jgi:orotidine-5'-phosphate decarboxylase
MIDVIISAIQGNNNFSSIVLDTTVDIIPEEIIEQEVKLRWRTPEAMSLAILNFNKEVINIIEKITPIITIPIEPYELYGTPGIKTLIKTIQHAHDKGLLVIGTCDKNSTGNMLQYASESYLGKVNIQGINTPIFDLDAITVNPFSGAGSINLYKTNASDNIFSTNVKLNLNTSIEYKYILGVNKSIFVTVRDKSEGTSIQDILITDENNPNIKTPVYLEIPKWITEMTKDDVTDYGFSPIGISVSANYTGEIKRLRDRYPKIFFLINNFIHRDPNIANVLYAVRKDLKSGAILCDSTIIRSHLDPTLGRGLSWQQTIRNSALDAKRIINNVLFPEI